MAKTNVHIKTFLIKTEDKNINGNGYCYHSYLGSIENISLYSFLLGKRGSITYEGTANQKKHTSSKRLFFKNKKGAPSVCAYN